MKLVTTACVLSFAIIIHCGELSSEPFPRKITIPKPNPIRLMLPEKDQRGLKLMEELIAEGFSPIIAAGFVGNASQESDIKPGICGRMYIGLFQYCGYRRHGLVRFAEVHDTTWKTSAIQAKWAKYELTEGTETEYYPPILKSKTPRDAAYRICRHYERANQSKAKNSFRGDEAERFYSLWKKCHDTTQRASLP